MQKVGAKVGTAQKTPGVQQSPFARVSGRRPPAVFLVRKKIGHGRVERLGDSLQPVQRDASPPLLEVGEGTGGNADHACQDFLADALALPHFTDFFANSQLDATSLSGRCDLRLSAQGRTGFSPDALSIPDLLV